MSQSVLELYRDTAAGLVTNPVPLCLKGYAPMLCHSQPRQACLLQTPTSQTPDIHSVPRTGRGKHETRTLAVRLLSVPSLVFSLHYDINVCTCIYHKRVPQNKHITSGTPNVYVSAG